MPAGGRRLSQQMTTTLIAAVIVLLLAGLLLHAWAAGIITFVVLVAATGYADHRRRQRVR